jgi:hypothetical protein
MSHIPFAASKEIIDAKDIVATGNEAVAEMGAKKAGTSSD